MKRLIVIPPRKWFICFLFTLCFVGLFNNLVLAGFKEGQEAFVKEDYGIAFNEWLPLAEKGHAEAQLNLSHLYIYGFGVAQDFNKAAEWLLKSARQGNVEAQTNLGTMLVQGRGVSKNYKKAIKWYSLAAQKNHSPAIFGLASMYANGLGVRKDYRKAFELSLKAANSDDLGGQFLLAQLYENGLGIEKNLVQALMWYGLVLYKSSIPFPEYKTLSSQASDAARKIVLKMEINEIEKATILLSKWRPNEEGQVDYKPPFDMITGNVKTIFFQGEVTIKDFNYEVTLFRLKRNDTYLEIKNATHLRLVENSFKLPEAFKVIAPMTAVKVIHGEIPKLNLKKLLLAHYLLLRKIINGE